MASLMVNSVKEMKKKEKIQPYSAILSLFSKSRDHTPEIRAT
jgi:hypothetical protein